MKYDKHILALLTSGKLLVFGCRIYMRCGTCRTYHRAHLTPDDDGYPRLSLQHHGRTLHLRAHRIVHVAAHGPTPFEIDHVEGDRADFRLCRLHPVTRAENVYRMQLRRHWREQAEERIAVGGGGPPF